jgi:predicted GIY-YIG superfamily endonuclease
LLTNVIPAKAGIHVCRWWKKQEMLKTYYIYIMANKKNGTLYIGVTNDLIRRVWQHKHDVFEGFTKK